MALGLGIFELDTEDVPFRIDINENAPSVARVLIFNVDVEKKIVQDLESINRSYQC